MENNKIATHGKVNLRELNLGQGGNNVRWLNDREDRILEKSLSSLERARQKTLSRLQHEVKGLHHTLREQVTIRSPQLSKKSYLPDNDNGETKLRSVATIHSVTFNLPDQILGSKSEDGARGLVEDVEESTLEHITLEDSSSHNENKSERHLGKTNNQAESAWTRKISPGHKTPLKRPLTKQLSNLSEQSSSSTTTVSVPRRKISVTDPPSMKKLSPRLRKTYSHSSPQVGQPANSTLNRAKARSSETILNIVSTHSSGNAHNEPFTPSLRKTSVESINRAASPLFLRRKLSTHHPPSLSPSPRPRRKISAPSKMQQQYRVQQEEVIPLQLSRDNNGSTSRPATTMVTDLPKLGVSHGIEHAQGLHFDGNVSPLGLHVDSMDCTLQEKVNNFLRSLERSEDSHEEKLPHRADNL